MIVYNFRMNRHDTHRYEEKLNFFISENNIDEENIIEMITSFDDNTLYITIIEKGDRATKISKNDYKTIDQIGEEMALLTRDSHKYSFEQSIRLGQAIYDLAYTRYANTIDFNYITSDCFYSDRKIEDFIIELSKKLFEARTGIKK